MTISLNATARVGAGVSLPALATHTGAPSNAVLTGFSPTGNVLSRVLLAVALN